MRDIDDRSADKKDDDGNAPVPDKVSLVEVLQMVNSFQKFVPSIF